MRSWRPSGSLAAIDPLGASRDKEKENRRQQEKALILRVAAANKEEEKRQLAMLRLVASARCFGSSPRL